MEPSCCAGRCAPPGRGRFVLKRRRAMPRWRRCCAGAGFAHRSRHCPPQGKSPPARGKPALLPALSSLPQKWVRGAPDGDGENALAVAHAFLRTHVRPGAFALDATAGNGHDTLFLCRLVGAAGRVLAFDVQPQAVENTNARLRENGCGQVGRAVLDSHANLAAYAAPGSVDAAVFNLGYLPGGDHGVFTTPGVSVPAMRTALELLRPGGVMTVCVYYGGPQGMAEKDAVLAFLTGLPPEGYRVSVRDFSGRPGCPPIPVCIEKRAW